MIRDLRVYPWSALTGKKYIVSQISTNESRFSAIASLSGDYNNNEIAVSQRDISSIRKNITGIDESYWESIEELIDDIHENNDTDPGLLLSISIALCKAASNGRLWQINGSRKPMKFPKVWFSVVRGRVSGSGSDWKSFMVKPKKCTDPMDMQERLVSFWSEIGKVFSQKGILIGKDLENRWITKLNTVDTLEALSGFCEDFNMDIGVDCGPWKTGKGNIYHYRNEGKELNESAQIDFVLKMIDSYKIKLFENPFIKGFSNLHSDFSAPKGCLLGTNIIYEENMPEALNNNVFDSFHASPDLFYNYTDMKRFSSLVRKKGKEMIFSSQDYSISDPWISDMGIALQMKYIKTNPVHGISILNRLNKLWFDVPNEEI